MARSRAVSSSFSLLGGLKKMELRSASAPARRLSGSCVLGVAADFPAMEGKEASTSSCFWLEAGES